MINQTRLQRADLLFQELLDVPLTDRDGLLAARCDGDEELRTVVRRLLDADSSGMQGFLTHPIEITEREALQTVPRSIGGYVIQREIGRGGMGVVYEALQQSPARAVALKVLRMPFPTRESLQRFRHEAEILGFLQHPGVAQIYEASVADVDSAAGAQQIPFFAMELVRGEPLTAYAQKHRLDPRQRLELFARVCDAVQHAHQKGVIHRDLKPANILVEPGEQAKILDFGVARVTDTDSQMTSMRTEMGQVIGTLAYMSPEQIAGNARHVDTRSDVYSLGVILYELLAGRLPHDFTEQNIAGAIRMVSETEPAPLDSIEHSYRGDVSTIVSKALERQPERRYNSAAELAEDIRRFLRHEPIAARPASTRYQVQKFAQRNKALVGGALATLTTLVLGVIGTSYGMLQMIAQRDEAQLQSRIVQAANDFLTEDLLDLASPENEPDRDLPMRVALDRAAGKLDAGRFADSPVLEANLRKAIGKAYSHLDQLDQAEPQLQRALELYSAAHGADGEQALLCRMELGTLLIRRRDLESAERVFLGLVDVQRALFGPEHKQTLSSLHNLGTIYADQRRFAEAEPLLKQILETRLRVLGDAEPTAVTLNVLGVVNLQLGRPAEGAELLQRSLDMHLRVSGDQHPHTLQTMANLGAAYHGLKEFDKSEEMLSRALEQHRCVLGDEHRFTLKVATQLAAVYGARKKPEREPLLRQTLEVQRRALGDNHRDTLLTSTNLARVAYDRGDFKPAEVEYRDLAARWAAAFPKSEHNGTAHMMHGRCLYNLERFDEAETELLEAHRIYVAVLGPAHERTRQAVGPLVDLYQAWGRPEAAAEWRTSTQPASPSAD